MNVDVAKLIADLHSGPPFGFMAAMLLVVFFAHIFSSDKTKATFGSGIGVGLFFALMLWGTWPA